MKLSKEDVKLFYRLYHPLLVYTNKKFNIISGINTNEDIKKFTIEKILKIRNKLYEHPELIDSFFAENPFNFSTDELKIIKSWKNFVKGSFIIYRYLKNYTIFLTVDDEEPKAYGVLALASTFEEMVGSALPVMVDAVLLPFNDKIIYDSILIPYRIRFGRGIRRSINDSFQRAKLRFGIITSLPISNKKIEQSDAERLKFYLKNAQNREIYSDEILELINKNEELLILYHQEMGKIFSRTIEKDLRKIGLINGWFAVLEGILIASGRTQEEVEQILKEILLPEKTKFVYIFQLKRK